MKRIAINLGVLFALMLSGGIFSAKAASAAPVSLQFQGDWVGSIKLPDRRKINIRVIITGNNVQQFYKDKEMFWQPLNLGQLQFSSQQEAAVFYSRREDSIRTETNIFALTLKDEQTIEVRFTYQVNRLINFYGNQTQKIEGTGTLWRVGF